MTFFFLGQQFLLQHFLLFLGPLEKNHTKIWGANPPCTRPWSTQSCSTAVKPGSPKREGKVLRTICGPKMVSTLNVTKTSRLRYAGHMIRKPEDLPQKALFRSKPNRRTNQGRPKSRYQSYPWDIHLEVSRHFLFFRFETNQMCYKDSKTSLETTLITK
jgi:hypothetical protein